MSLSKDKKHIKNEMKAGVHLAFIFDMKRHLDDQKNPIIVDGELAILVTFSTGDNKYHDQVYWLGKGNDGREKFFTQMCLDAGIDMSKTPLAKKEALNKRLWIAIREVFTLVDNGENIKKDITGKEIVENFVFKTSPIWDVEKQPTWKGDPLFNDGIACEEFVGYKEENESGWDTVSNETAPAVIEVKAVTPEIEKAVAVVEKVKKAKKVLAVEVVSAPENTMPNFGGTQIAEPLPENTTSVQPSFGGESEYQKMPPVQPLVESRGIIDVPNFGEPTSTPLPNFGDDQSPDANFGK